MFAKPEFEPAFRWEILMADASKDVSLQRRLTITAGDTLSAVAYPDDPVHSTDFLDEGACGPCKLIHVTVPRTGDLTVRLTTVAEPFALGLKVEPDGLVAQDVGCCQPLIERAFHVSVRDVLVFVYQGTSARSVPFEVLTELH
jgi:hypothetical protein